MAFVVFWLGKPKPAVNDKQAIAALQRLIEEQKTVKNDTDEIRAWVSKVKSITGTIFSTNSLEYQELVAFKDAWYGGEDWKQENEMKNIEKRLPQYIDLVKIRGVHKEPELPKVNILYRIPNKILYSVTGGFLLIIISLFSWLLNELWQANIKINKYELRNSSTTPVTNDKATGSPGDSAGKTNSKYDKTKADSANGLNDTLK